MRQYKFRALITLGQLSREDAALGHLGGTHAWRLVQPRDGEIFPAVISPEEVPPLRAEVHAVVTAELAGSEAEALFPPGQRFTIWADAVVGHTIRADGLVGHGVISRPGSLLPPVRTTPGLMGRRPARPVDVA